MMKYVLLAGAMMIAGPAFAQDTQTTRTGRTPIAGTATTTPTDQAAPQPTQAAPVAQPMDQVTPTTPAQTAQAAPAPTPAQTTEAPVAQAADASTTTAQPATSGDQVAAVVGKEFPTYDADKNGNLSQTEFASWMVALKKASDPATVADSPATKSWIGAAFAQADKDKSKSVTQAELTGFLSQGQS